MIKWYVTDVQDFISVLTTKHDKRFLRKRKGVGGAASDFLKKHLPRKKWMKFQRQFYRC